MHDDTPVLDQVTDAGKGSHDQVSRPVSDGERQREGQPRRNRGIAELGKKRGAQEYRRGQNLDGEHRGALARDAKGQARLVVVAGGEYGDDAPEGARVP